MAPNVTSDNVEGGVASEESEEALEGDDVAAEREELEGIQESLHQVRDVQTHLQNDISRCTIGIEYAELLSEKLKSPKVYKNGKDAVKCGVRKGKDNLPCANPGKLQYGLFCGVHAACVTSEGFEGIMKFLHVTGVPSLLASGQDYTAQIAQFVQEKQGETHAAKYHLEVSKREGETLAKEEKEKKEAVKKLRGRRVAQLFQSLEKDIGVMFSHRGGEFSMVGNCCRKVLDHQEKFLNNLKDQTELFEKYSGLFQRTKAIVDILFQITPFRVVKLTPAEQEILQAAPNPAPAPAPQSGPAPNSDPNADVNPAPAPAPSIPSSPSSISEVDFCVLLLQELQDYFVKEFPNLTPIPKQHFLCFHATEFLKRWLCTGMFAEQAIESIHAIMNRGVSKFRSFGVEGAHVKTIHSINARFEGDAEACKLRKLSGNKRRPFGGGTRCVKKRKWE